MVVIDRGTLRTDVLILGGGPAGLAAAIAARQKGFKVTVADCGHPPIDKACGEGVMPWGVRALTQLDVTLASVDSFCFRGIRFIGCGVVSEATFPDGRGSGVRRTALHRILMDRARAAGVELWWDARPQMRSGEPISINGKHPAYDWLVGADGQQSGVRRWAGLETGRPATARFGFRRHFRVTPWTDCVEVYWGEHSQLFVTPVGTEEICVAVLTRNGHARLAEELPSFPEIARRLKDAQPLSSERGGMCVNRSFPRVTRDNMALLGDASGSVDAITGDGISLAFEQAIALAAAIEKGDLNIYQEAHRGILRPATLMARLMLKLDRYAWLRRRVLRRLASEPGLFTGIFAGSAGSPQPASSLRRTAELAWRLLA